MTPIERVATIRFLKNLLVARSIDNGPSSAVRAVLLDLSPVIHPWGTPFVARIEPSGSFTKGTVVRGGTDIDIFISLPSTLNMPLREIYDRLFQHLSYQGLQPVRQNVSIGLQYKGFSVDVTPGRRQGMGGAFHSLYSNKSGTWLQTNVQLQAARVRSSGRIDEIRLMKIWRNRLGIEWPSFHLELFVINALWMTPKDRLLTNSRKFWKL